jgi:hypothetical protein
MHFGSATTTFLTGTTTLSSFSGGDVDERLVKGAFNDLHPPGNIKHDLLSLDEPMMILSSSTTTTTEGPLSSSLLRIGWESNNDKPEFVTEDTARIRQLKALRTRYKLERLGWKEGEIQDEESVETKSVEKLTTTDRMDMDSSSSNNNQKMAECNPIRHDADIAILSCGLHRY